MAQSCVAASGDTMNSIGVYEEDLWIKGKKVTHPVNVIKERNDITIGIDFMLVHKLTYDVNTELCRYTPNNHFCSKTNNNACNDLKCNQCQI